MSKWVARGEISEGRSIRVIASETIHFMQRRGISKSSLGGQLRKSMTNGCMGSTLEGVRGLVVPDLTKAAARRFTSGLLAMSYIFIAV